MVTYIIKACVQTVSGTCCKSTLIGKKLDSACMAG